MSNKSTDEKEIQELHNNSAELMSLKQTILESDLKKYFPKKEMSFHDKVVFAIANVCENKLSENDLIKAKISVYEHYTHWGEEIAHDARNSIENLKKQLK